MSKQEEKNIYNPLRVENFVSDMARTIAAWLNYCINTSGKLGVQENVINHPIRNFLVCHQDLWETAHFEEGHPYLLYKRMDMSFRDKDNVNHYFEFKQAKEDTKDTSEQKRIYADLVRLAICKKKENDCRCFFLIFGNVEDYKKYFVEFVDGKKKSKGEKNQDECFYSKWFDFTSYEKYIKVETANQSLLDDEKSLLEYFKEDCDARKPYLIMDIIPEHFYTHLVWSNYTQDSELIAGTNCTVGLWEILIDSPSEKKEEMISIDTFVKSLDGDDNPKKI